MCSAISAAAGLSVVAFNGVVGNVAACSEGAIKALPDSIGRDIGVVFARSIENLFAFGSSFACVAIFIPSPIALTAALAIGTVVIAAPFLTVQAEIFYRKDTVSVYRAFDFGMNALCKTINVASVALGLCVFTTPIVYVPSLIALTGINAYALLKK